MINIRFLHIRDVMLGNLALPTHPDDEDINASLAAESAAMDSGNLVAAHDDNIALYATNNLVYATTMPEHTITIQPRDDAVPICMGGDGHALPTPHPLHQTGVTHPPGFLEFVGEPNFPFLIPMTMTFMTLIASGQPMV